MLYSDNRNATGSFGSFGSLSTGVVKETKYTPLKNSIRIADEFSSKLPVTDLHGAPLRGADSNPHRYKYLNIDTRFSDDFSGFDNATFNVMLPERLTNIKSMTVTNMEVFLSYFNISAAKGNNTFRITNVHSGLHTTVTIPDGQYNISSLQTAVSGVLPSGVSYQVDSQGHSIFTILDPSGSPQYVEFYTDSRGGYDKRNPKFKLGWIMGFRNVAYPISAGGSLVSESLVNLNGPRYLYLVVDEFQNGKGDSFVSVLSTSLTNKQIIARVAISQADYLFGSIVSANLANGLLISDTRTYGNGGGGGGGGKVDIQQLNIQLVDETGTVVDLNGDDLSFCLKLEYE